jgi:hypothetical protein
MKNFSQTFSSIFHKMSDKTPIVNDVDDSTGASASASASGSINRIVHFPRINEEQPPVQPNSNSSAFGYEELMHGSVPCPSCDGSGRIPKGTKVCFMQICRILKCCVCNFREGKATCGIDTVHR